MQEARLVISVAVASGDNSKALHRRAMAGTGSSYGIDLLKSIRCVQSVQSKTRRQQQKKYII